MCEHLETSRPESTDGAGDLVVYVLPREFGAGEVSARVGELEPTTATYSAATGPPSAIRIEPSEVPVRAHIERDTEITVTIYDFGDNPVPDVTVVAEHASDVLFSVTPGSATTDANGEVVFRVLGGEEPSLTWWILSFQAGDVRNYIYVTLYDDPVTLIQGPLLLPDDVLPGDEVQLSVKATDSRGSDADQVSISWEVTRGDLELNMFESVTRESGEAAAVVIPHGEGPWEVTASALDGEGETLTFSWTLMERTHRLDNVDPTRVIAGTGVELELEGEGFRADSQIVWGEMLLDPTSHSRTILKVPINAAYVATGPTEVSVLTADAETDSIVVYAGSLDTPCNTGEDCMSGTCTALTCESGSMVRIDHGSFVLGFTDEGTTHHPPHWVVDGEDFYIEALEAVPSDYGGEGSTPIDDVTWFEALELLNQRSAEEGYSECYSFIGCELDDRTGRTCDEITWHTDCVGYRLPSEAEWEYAARTDDPAPGIAWYCGTEESCVESIAWCDGATHASAEKDPNDFELYDMIGNVAEWVWDPFGPYTQPDQPDPTSLCEDGLCTIVPDDDWQGGARYGCDGVYGRDNRDPTEESENEAGFRAAQRF